MFIGFAVAGYFGPTIMNNVYNADGSYQRAFIIAGALGIAGLVMSFVYRIVKKKEA